MAMHAVPPSPEITIIVAVHNVRDQVGAAIASLRAQSFPDFEALVIDDGSTDGSADVAREAWGDDPRFRLIQQANRGLSAARNTGLAQARGAFVAFLDGDDAYAPACLAALRAAIQREGTDWSACAINLWYADGSEIPHPAMHACKDTGEARCLSLTDARDAVRVFPSAWNKLYRRASLADLRFTEGSWFEDHEFFWAFAAAHPDLAYIPDPLYRHRRGRVGQITGTDSDRVFEQFDVLARVRMLMSRFEHPHEGFARLATQLLHERAKVIRDRERRARFLAETRLKFEAWGIRYSPEWDPSISLGFGRMLDGVLPLSVVVFAGDEGLRETLQAVAQQNMSDFDLHVVAAPDTMVPAQLEGGICVQRWTPEQFDIAGLAGDAVAFFASGDRPTPDGLLWLLNMLERYDTPLAFGAFHVTGQGLHDGWVDNRTVEHALPAPGDLGAPVDLSPVQALRIYPALGNRIIRRSHLLGVSPSQPGRMDICAVQALIWASAAGAGRFAYTRLPVAEIAVHKPVAQSPWRVAAWAAALPEPAHDDLPRGWRGALFFRMMGMGAETTGFWYWTAALVAAARVGILRAEALALPDPGIPDRVLEFCYAIRLKDP